MPSFQHCVEQLLTMLADHDVAVRVSAAHYAATFFQIFPSDEVRRMISLLVFFSRTNEYIVYQLLIIFSVFQKEILADVRLKLPDIEKDTVPRRATALLTLAKVYNLFIIFII